ncbi:phosphate acyltransferase PlsX [Vibrio sp. SS-MA-C1-2]|uniref:phosphate acyltransferase PlsX n=1 Tax=Vibrio sp. SS-MA-C1-2 TaxID=2908646 RepID=UPI001F1C9D28|nr:phosphate acyltransferase PlsX [Vibrio sp. SS-MA-C1-2]UJF19915.1 phosphate acyltransferase PlsX [Vibrio sp. SS-MA-C1-2]
MTGITLAIDAMGGDHGPLVIVPASVQALSHFPSLKIILIGDHSLITEQLIADDSSILERLTIVHTEQVIADELQPSKALRSSKNSSMSLALDYVESGHADACVSAGNTGALMVLSRLKLKSLSIIERPALVSVLPTNDNKRVWLLDLGANVNCDVDMLYQFALMGSVLAEEHLNYQPRVGLLNIGSEQNKGNDTIRHCSQLLSETKDINYIGYIEGNDIYNDKVDVIVCDGFVGNVCLKTSEGVADLFVNKFRNHLNRHKIKGIIAKWLFSELFKEIEQLNPDQYNGASLLGLRGIVVKSHGRADHSAFFNAIEEAIQEVERKIPDKIRDRLETVLIERHY